MDAPNPCAHQEPHAVRRRVLCSGDGHLKGVDHARRRAPETAGCPIAYAGLQLVQVLRIIDDAEPQLFGMPGRSGKLVHAIGDAVSVERHYPLAVIGREPNDKRARTMKREPELAGPGAVQLASTGIDRCLDRMRGRIVASMDESAVCL